MVKLNGWEETILSVLILGETLLLTGLSNVIMVVFFLSRTNLSIFLPLNLAIYRICNAPNIMCFGCKEQDESHPNPQLLFYL